MGIETQIAGLIVVVLLNIFYLSHKTLGLYKEKVFLIVFFTATVTLSLDIISVILIKNLGIDNTLVEIGGKLYLCSLIMYAWSAFIYALSDVVDSKKHAKYMRISTILFFVECALVMITKISFVNEDSYVYSEGIACYLTYAFCIIYFILSIVVAAVNVKKISSRRAFVISLWMFIIIVAAVIQFITKSLLLVGFSGAIGTLILYVMLENPEAYQDKKYECFNSYAFNQYVNTLLTEKEEFKIVEITTNRFNINDIDIDLSNSIIRKSLFDLAKYKDIKIFRHSDSGFISISNNEETLKETRQLVINLISQFGFLKNDVYTIYIKNGQKFTTAQSILKFLTSQKKCTLDDERVLRVSDEMIDSFNNKDLISREIDLAISENRLEVFYQPIYSSVQKRFAAAEALARIRLKDGSLLSPGSFIPVAEETGQIIYVGEKILEKVCEFIKTNGCKELGVDYIDVNLSVVQCEQKDLSQRMHEILEKYQIDSLYINLEITESSSINSKITLLDNMKNLIEKGFSFSLDDFGKGESNLDCVIDMPLSVIKIDNSLTKEFFFNEKARQVLKAIINMVHSLNLKLVVEGIETEEEYEIITDEGVDYIQGYLFSKPLPEKEFIEFLKNKK